MRSPAFKASNPDVHGLREEASFPADEVSHVTNCPGSAWLLAVNAVVAQPSGATRAS